MRKFLLVLLLSLSFVTYAEEDNLIIPCRHSQEMLDLILDCISEGEQKIELSLCFTGGKVFLDILDRLEKRMQERSHLQVYMLNSAILLIDSDLSSIHRLLSLYPQQFHHQLTHQVFHPLPEVANMDNHIKTIIVDEKYFTLGGTNFDEAFICAGTSSRPHVNPAGLARDQLPDGNRDQDVVGRGSLAKELREAFYKQYALWEHYNNSNREDFIENPEDVRLNSYYKAIEDSAKRAFVASFEGSSKKIKIGKCRLIVSGPMDYPNKITQEYEQLIRNAQKDIYIGNLYFNPVSSIFSALLEKVRKGVGCHLITNGLFDHSPFFHGAFVWANRINYSPLFYGREANFWERRELLRMKGSKTTIYEYCVPGIMYHKKTMVVDRRFVVIGSYNLGLRSATTDYEAILVLDSPELAERFLDIFEEDRKYSKEITREEALDWYFDPVIGMLGAIQRQFHGFF